MSDELDEEILMAAAAPPEPKRPKRSRDWMLVAFDHAGDGHILDFSGRGFEVIQEMETIAALADLPGELDVPEKVFWGLWVWTGHIDIQCHEVHTPNMHEYETDFYFAGRWRFPTDREMATLRPVTK